MTETLTSIEEPGAIPPAELNFTEMDRAEMAAVLAELRQPRFRADQLYRWVFQRGARSFDEMTDFPKRLRAQLAEAGYSVGRARLGTVQVSVDNTRKLAVRLADGAVVETVLIPMEDGRFTQCLSSQVGCALGCKFCFTATLGLSRNLTPGEIVDQIILARTVLPEGWRVKNLVYMGMGEPLHNLKNVLKSLEAICNPDGLGYVHRRVTVSTSGLVPQIDALGEAAPVNLAVSLNATTDEVRDRIMPVNKRYPIATLIAALRRYPLPPRRKMTFEYVLLGGLNDTDDDARRLVKLTRGLEVRVNLLPWNPFAGPGYERPASDRVRAFQQILQRGGVTVTVRTTKGLDIDAACGQLGERPTASS